MFREMGRKNQLLNEGELENVLNRCTNGILACIGDDEYPYAVPLSYVYHNKKIYFHSAKSGHKVDAIMKNPKVSFAIVDEDRIVSAEYTTYFRSVIAFGKARIANGDEHLDAFMALVEKYSKDQSVKDKGKEISNCKNALIVAIDIEHMTGKEAIELVREKNK